MNHFIRFGENKMDKNYLNHPIFEQLSKYKDFYGDLSVSVMGIPPLGISTIYNHDSYIFSSMEGTLDSIREILISGHINDAFALLRKFYDAAIINIYIILYLEEYFNIENFVVEKIDNWINGKESLPDIREINNYLKNSSKAIPIYHLLDKDKRYKELRNRCNDHTHYNFFFNAVLNDNQIYLEKRVSYLNLLSNDLKNVVIYHLSYLFYLKDKYMMSSDYIECLEEGLQPEEDSQYLVAPFIQEFFDSEFKVSRPDIVEVIIENTAMKLE